MGEITVAKIAVSRAVYAIDRPYDYLVPDELAKDLQPGMRVLVPFGSGSRACDGIVLAIEQRPLGEKPLKPMQTKLDDHPVLTSQGIQLALWLREWCFCTVYDAVRAMLPAGLYYALRDRVILLPGMDQERAEELAGSAVNARRLLQLLFTWGGQGDLQQIREAFGPKDPNPAIRLLVERGVATVETSAQRGVGDKTERLAVLAMPAEEAMALVAPRRRTAPLRYAVTELLCGLGAASAKELCYFTGASNATLKSLERSGILTLEKQEVLRHTLPEDVPPGEEIILNQEQQRAFLGLKELLEGGSAAALLYGVTGSGKTLVYIRLIQEVMARGRTAMVLVPEIALTPQLLRRFVSYFGQQVALLHSSLGSGERYDEWKRVRRGDARLVIGTRSAVFAPLEHLGLIVLDEEQEGSYKSEQNPRYHARDVAKYRCAQDGALLLLGSATPSVESMYKAREGIYHLFTLPSRYNRRQLPPVELVDMKEELRQGNATSISVPLREALRDNLVRGEQSILFLNRRGASRMVTCGECGQVPTCPRCSVHLTYHSANGRLMCHYCGHSQPLPPACPVCGGGLNFVGMGTQRVEEELKELFPHTEILRMDTDTVSAAHSHEQILSRFQSKKVPILVGTQMVAKGLDFENVTLVGVVSADLSLYISDYRASERTFSLLTQVVGRAGRGEKGGRALIQTYTPDNDVLRCAARQDYDTFYQEEIQLRRLRQCQPFQDEVVFTASGLSETAVLQACARLRQALCKALECIQSPWTLLGPAPAAVTKVNNRYRYRLTLNCRNSRALRRLVAQILRDAQQDKKNRGVSVFADLNPMD